MGARRTSQLCREFIDGTAANGFCTGEAFGECAALFLTTLLEGDDITSGNTAVTTDTMGRDLPGIKKLVQMGPAHPQALRHLSGRVVGHRHGPSHSPMVGGWLPSSRWARKRSTAAAISSAEGSSSPVGSV